MATGGEASGWLLIGAGIAALVVQQVACTSPDDTGDAVDLTPYLENVGWSGVEPALSSLREELIALRAAVETGDPPTQRVAFGFALQALQVAEPMQIGPAGSSLTAAGGLDLRGEIYSWPTVNPCRVDQATASGEYADADFHTANNANAYGLDALEHLIYADDANVCPGQVPPNSDGAWDALGVDGVAANRDAYKLVVIDGMVAQVDAIVAHWQGDFGAEFIAGEGPYDSQLDALNAVFDALFYIELVTKDAKLGEPLGLGDCTTDCAELVEHGQSGLTYEAIAANLDGFDGLFALSLGPLLADRGQGDLRDRVISATDGAREATGSDDLQTTYDAVKVLTDLLKGEVSTTLNLQIPTEADGDVD